MIGFVGGAVEWLLQGNADGRFGSDTAPSVTVQTEAPFFKEKEPVMQQLITSTSHRDPWNKGKLVGQKAPLRKGKGKGLGMLYK